MTEPEWNGEIGLGKSDGRRFAGRLWAWGIAGSAVLSVVYLAVLLQVTDSSALNSFDNVSGLAVSVLAAFTLLICARKARQIPGQAAGAWLLLGLGYIAFAIGEALTALGGGYGLGGLSYVMDAFYLAYYPLLLPRRSGTSQSAPDRQ